MAASSPESPPAVSLRASLPMPPIKEINKNNNNNTGGSRKSSCVTPTAGSGSASSAGVSLEDTIEKLRRAAKKSVTSPPDSETKTRTTAGRHAPAQKRHKAAATGVDCQPLLSPGTWPAFGKMPPPFAAQQIRAGPPTVANIQALAAMALGRTK